MNNLKSKKIDHDPAVKSIINKLKDIDNDILSMISQNRQVHAVNYALDLLKQFRIRLPKSPNVISLHFELIKIKRLIKKNRINDLLRLPEINNEKILAAAHIISKCLSAAYSSVPELLPYLSFKQVDLSIRYGLAPFSAYSFATCGLVLCSMGDIKTGIIYSNLALKLQRRLKAIEYTAHTLFTAYYFSLHWKYHVKKALKPLLHVIKVGMKTNSMNFSAYAANTFTVYTFLSGINLRKADSIASSSINFINKGKMGKGLNHYNLITKQAIANLINPVEQYDSLKGQFYDEDIMIPIHKGYNDLPPLYFIYFNKFFLSYLFGDCDIARKHIQSSELYIKGIMSTFHYPIHFFYSALVYTGLFMRSRKKERSSFLKRIKKALRLFEEWSRFCPDNYINKYVLLKAEYAKICGDAQSAMNYYQQSVKLSKKNGFIQETAISCELAGKFYSGIGQEIIARCFIKKCHLYYEKWGALNKIQRLSEEYSYLTPPIIREKSKLIWFWRKMVKKKNPLRIKESILKRQVNQLEEDKYPHTTRLSDQEKRVVDLLKKGMLYKEIAYDLNVSLNTIRTYVKRIHKKMGVKTTEEIIKLSEIKVNNIINSSLN
ncbi:MAG: hypothetical protein JW969_00960 [Spirochaetales bacterium]|nr:hypothetical protein [Spirochaetales bacterium]